MSDNPQAPTEVRAPALRTRPRGLLLHATESIDTSDLRPTDPGERNFDLASHGGLVGGVTFCPVGCDGLVTAENTWCSVDEIPTVDQAVDFDGGGGPVFDSFAIWSQEIAPARFDAGFVSGRATDRFARRSAAIAHELLTGSISGNPSLSSEANQIVAAATPVAEALYVIEDLAAELDDAVVMIHADPATFALLEKDWTIEQEDKESADDPNDAVFRTPTGHIVVGDAGHDGTVGPGGDDAADGTRWVYASLMVQTWLGDLRRLGEAASFDRERNTMRYSYVQEALVGFDPCWVAAVLVDVPTYTVTGSGS